MSETSRCLAPAQLRQLVESGLSDVELANAEAHLSSCPTCRAALDDTRGDVARWNHGCESSGKDAPDSDTDHGEASRSAHFSGILNLLGPSENPIHLGRIDNYEVVGVLGQGGMGVVFKGFDAALNRYVAIKMLLPHLAVSGSSRKQFAREAQAAAAVVDDHVIAIHSIAEWQGAPYIVMPFVAGESLQDRLKNKKPLALAEILRIGAQTARGLAAAHKQGLVHRDIKPANILLPEGTQRIALTDFGLARAVDDANVTRTDAIVGTPRYMSPEHVRGQGVEIRSDLFSLGSVLYAMSTGEAPFKAETTYGVLRLITDEEPRRVTEINPKIPEWLGQLIHKLMSKQPQDRFASAIEVAELLEKGPTRVPNMMPSKPAPSDPKQVPNFNSVAMARWGIAGAILATFGLLLCGVAVLTNLVDRPSSSSKSPEPDHVAKTEIAPRAQRAAEASQFADTTLQGTWQMVSSVDDVGKPADEGHVKAVTYVVRGNMIEFHNADNPSNVPKSRIAFDANHFPLDQGTPKQFVLLDYMTTGADAHPMVGLCDADATTLKICWGPQTPEKLGPAPGVTYAELRKVPDPPPHDTPAAQPGAKAP